MTNKLFYLTLILTGLFIYIQSPKQSNSDKPSLPPQNIHITAADNCGCEVICENGICTITCPYKGGCKPEGDCSCIVENGELRSKPDCCPMYNVCRPCKNLKDGTYKGHFANGICTYKIPLN